MTQPLPGSVLADPLESVRTACARVARRARHVAIDEAGLARAADAAPRAGPPAATLAAPDGLDRRGRVSFVLALDAINFGSGWFPQLQKEPGLSGYRTLETRLRRHFESGAPDARTLVAATPERCAGIFGQPLRPPLDALLELFARAWRDLGQLLLDRFEADPLALVASARSAADLVRVLLEMPLYRDVAHHDGDVVPFLKRAQITAADLASVAPDAASFPDLDRLTLFADNLVPHVLRLDGVLRFDPALVAHIDREELLGSGSPEEVEIRACAVHAVERLAAQTGLAPRHLDTWLWLRGASPPYKSRPRHRTRCPYY